MGTAIFKSKILKSFPSYAKLHIFIVHLLLLRRKQELSSSLQPASDVSRYAMRSSRSLSRESAGSCPLSAQQPGYAVASYTAQQAPPLQPRPQRPPRPPHRRSRVEGPRRRRRRPTGEALAAGALPRRHPRSRHRRSTPSGLPPVPMEATRSPPRSRTLPGPALARYSSAASCAAPGSCASRARAAPSPSSRRPR